VAASKIQRTVVHPLIGVEMRHKVGLYDPYDERDSCGVGLAVNIDGKRDRRIVEYGLQLLENMEHRGAENADGKTGDGAGITVQVPHEFIRSLGIDVPEAGRYGTGLIFLPRDTINSQRCMDIFRGECNSQGVHVICEREVPVNHSVPGPLASETEPNIVQVFLTSYDSQDVLEHKLYSVRKLTENRVSSAFPEIEDFYICSLSSKCIVYKGMLTPVQLRTYYADLSDENFISAISLVHSRFSTNTFPKWKLAQPFRMLCHNGEINTIKGNRSWMKARESVLTSPWFKDIDPLFPIIQEGMSDSASLDNVFEFLTMSGKSMTNSLSIMVPESWNNKNPIPDSLKAYYEYHSMLMEPWDGPAAILFTDGRYAGGMLDRNGLRPARYSITNDGLLILASEAGVIQIPESELKEAGRLIPGKMMVVDTLESRVIYDDEIKNKLASAYPYRDWLERNRIELDGVSSGREMNRSVSDMEIKLAEFGYAEEDISKILEPMASQGKEPTGSMGSDTPLAILSDQPQRLFNYFRQSFAQVTNPPIDPIREELVMSVTGYIGQISQNILDPTPRHCNMIKVRHPIITNREIDLLKNMRYRGFNTTEIRITFPSSEGHKGLEKALVRICKEAEAAADGDGSYLILSDKHTDKDNVAIPSLLAVSTVHQYLVSKKKRVHTGIILESGEPREVMHFALLFGYGANVVNPYMVYALIEKSVKDEKIKIDIETAERNYIRASEKGLMKIMSKMGISTIRSYIGARLFEAVGLDKDVAADYFGNTSSPIGGVGLEEIAADAISSHRSAFSGEFMMKTDGIYSYTKNGEKHAWSPDSVRLLHKAVIDSDFAAFRDFTEKEDTELFFIRSLLDIKNGTQIPLRKVEPAESIMRRFVGEGISFGAISKESHETFTEAMNRIGGQSNTGEGGEDPKRYSVLPDGRDIRSKVKQVASGRFGVTVQYLTSADEIQIKVAQGAKPGEGGQLLGPKVDEMIAHTRNTIPGITLISPPPHHDIYSIEDLKQLIFDMRCVNPTARISVKLVSENGIGAVASGVVKAGADAILISGADGGTGASPLSSIRYAGMPWELGLAEAHQTLIVNGLREKVTLQVDGQMKTGRDVIISALLGAEEYGFSTAPMIAMGCVMCRRCHLNTCPMGIATQDPEKRAGFKAKPEHVINYFRLLAEDVRRHLANMGFRSLEDIIGHFDMLKQRTVGNMRADTTDLSSMLETVSANKLLRPEPTVQDVLDKRIIRDAKITLETGMPVKAEYKIFNTDRSVGAMLSGELTRRKKVLDDDTITVTFEGTAGQSFGCFVTKGVTFVLKGQANDYVGKGLSGGKIAVFHEEHIPRCNVIAGNTILYGATGGEAYISGKVGERFCVRNSGAIAVAEGAGDHCCEYMTGGRTVILGEVGRNFAAGMSAGVAYVLNDNGDFDRHCNMDMVELSPVESFEDKIELRNILEEHVKHTGSKIATEMITDWNLNVKRFLKVMPIGYKKLLQSVSLAEK